VLYFRLEKDALQRLNNLSMQRDKAEETYKKESEKLVSRIDDLNKQLESMMEKFRVIFHELIISLYFLTVTVLGENG
jgi:hypothetical protein